eukprot:CAMPEP_0175064036 /NCGR_PEP_ID=MMETSP0052_2-20121109/15098_1 /TAXON_ID=51329 ORGANISM="Polytomella parva, Strain SAG 63-3" /NCGR_SAMPLE_ID=MMETSP0052_2 /ASSEMBLY_ACC=CAM_ASM_000194 /LENGTH=271 /DNA_ID=CAMNT_0016330319 /DNA_START=127 /DNA_END=942 /DNA_ORIENTATION=-
MLFFYHSSAVKIKVAPGTTECVSQTFSIDHFSIPGGPRIDGRLLIGTTNHYYRPFVSIRLLSPSDDQIWQQQHVYSEAHFNVAPRGPGTYKACFYNPWESRTDALVDLVYFTLAHLRTSDSPVQIPKGLLNDRNSEIAHQSHVEQARKTITGMSEFMQVISGSQKYLERRLDIHKKTLESNKKRTLGYASLEVMVIAIVVLAQVFTVHGLFESSGIASRFFSKGIGAKILLMGGGGGTVGLLGGVSRKEGHLGGGGRGLMMGGGGKHKVVV